MTKTETLDDAGADNARVGCHCCQHRVDVPGVDQVVCLAHLAVFVSASGDDCQEFEPKARPGGAGAASPTR